MNNKPKKEIRAYGVKVLLSHHPEIRRLKRHYYPTSHGNKFWTSSWLIMDYFRKHGMENGTRILEIGCGWGLAGIYCAKKHGAVVTGVDIDSDVLPFSRLHAEINKLDITFMKKSFNDLKKKDLEHFDILIGADICFWDDMAGMLRRLIKRALQSGVKLVLIADPVRSPFEELCEYFVDKKTAEILDYSVRSPKNISGQILKITSDS